MDNAETNGLPHLHISKMPEMANTSPRKNFLPQVLAHHLFFLFRMTATGHPALWTTLFDTLPKNTRLIPVEPRDPITIRSGRRYREVLRISVAGLPNTNRS